MSFTDQKPFVVTEEQTKVHWGGGFWCKLCGHRFKAGDTARWVYANSTPGAGCGNFMVCDKCDGPDVLKRGIADHKAMVNGCKRWGMYAPDWQDQRGQLTLPTKEAGR